MRRKCQAWGDGNPKKTSQADIAAGLLTVLGSATDADLDTFSRHLSESTFDVPPVTAGTNEIKATIRSLPGLTKFLEDEGRLVRWACDF